MDRHRPPTRSPRVGGVGDAGRPLRFARYWLADSKMQFAGPACRKRNQGPSRTPQASPLTCGDDCRRIDPTDGLYSRRCGFRVAREATLNLARVMIQAHTTTLLPASRHRLRARSAPHHSQERKQGSTAEAPCDGEPQRRTTGRVASGRTPASERARCGIIPGEGKGLTPLGRRILLASERARS